MFFFVLFSLARFGLNLGFLDRPLVIGLFWAALTGQWESALAAALFFELFYLDLFPIGTYVPPHGPFALLVTLALAQTHDAGPAQLVAVLILLSLPAAHVGSALEQTVRQRQNLSYTRMLQSTRPGREQSVSPAALARGALVQTCVVQAAAFLLVMAVLVPLAEWVLLHVQQRALSLPMSWSHLWMLGTVGALLSFRTRRVYAVFLTTILAAGLIFAAAGGLV